MDKTLHLRSSHPLAFVDNFCRYQCITITLLNSTLSLLLSAPSHRHLSIDSSIILSIELDYYHLLGIPRNATEDKIKTAYHRILLQSHPDKRIKSPNLRADSTDIALIREAYATLKDPLLRKAHNTALDHAGLNERGPRPAQIVSLEEFAERGEVENGTGPGWTHNCRCGGIYHITANDLECGRHLVGCQSCSEVIWVGYEVIED